MNPCQPATRQQVLCMQPCPSPRPCAALSPRSQQENVTFLMNSQSLEALAFRVDVTLPREGGRLLARGIVPHQVRAERAALPKGWQGGG